jgi:hypothetical protein
MQSLLALSLALSLNQPQPPRQWEVMSAVQPPRLWEIGSNDTINWRQAYATIKAESIRTRTPFVAGNRCTPVVPQGYLYCQTDFPEIETCLMVGVPSGGETWMLLFHPESSAPGIRRAVEAERNRWQRLIAPFPLLPRQGLFNRRGEVVLPLAVDVSVTGHGPWPKDLPFPEGMVAYYPAQHTQSIATTDRRPSITPGHRSNLEEKWGVPGGMVGVDGWHSDLYRYVPTRPVEWVGSIPVLNQYNSFQSERGWIRRYPNGTVFADVLSNADGKVFEVRMRSKESGAWTNDVAYRDKSARPAGYAGFSSKDCLQCHNTFNGAGTGGYASGLVPGSDTVISDPIAALER